MHTLTGLQQEYLHHLKALGKSVKNARLSLRLLREYLESTDVDFRHVKIRHAQDFQAYLSTATDDEGGIRYSKGSVQNFMGSVSSFYDHLRRKKIIYSNPFLEVQRVKTGKSLPKNILHEEEMNVFLSHLKRFGKGGSLIQRRNLYKAHVVAELMYSTGARIHEVMKLKPGDLDFTRGTVRITDTKTARVREGILNGFAEKVLRIYVEEMREYVLFGKNNADPDLLFGARAHLKTWLNGILGKESEKCGLGKFTSHHFRHAVGYHLLRGGCDIRFIQEILGHKQLHSTQIYTKVDKDDLKSVLDEFHPRRLGEGNEKL
jgi:site-specific recombinase XerD